MPRPGRRVEGCELRWGGGCLRCGRRRHTRSWGRRRRVVARLCALPSCQPLCHALAIGLKPSPWVVATRGCGRTRTSSLHGLALPTATAAAAAAARRSAAANIGCRESCEPGFARGALSIPTAPLPVPAPGSASWAPRLACFADVHLVEHAGPRIIVRHGVLPPPWPHTGERVLRAL